MQADTLRPTVNSLGIDQIFCSTSQRTRQTAERLNADLRLPVDYWDSLREISLGPWEQRLWSEVEQESPALVHLFAEQPHRFELAGAESFQQLQSRGVNAIEKIVADSSACNVLVVSHGALLLVTLAHYAGVDLARLRDGIELPNCSHSVLQLDDNDQISIKSIAGMAVSETGW